MGEGIPKQNTPDNNQNPEKKDEQIMRVRTAAEQEEFEESIREVLKKKKQEEDK
ncbi:MAG TPA: hypothetical protein VJH63_03420 [Candidatus Paceibacterota bacterium]